LAKLSGRYDAFIGFGGVDQCKFREAVFPPARLFLLAASLEQRPRRIVSAVQGVIDDRIIFEATLVGLIIP
jgi:3-hydroxyacyl-[acyl-carrier-protein] dehydratase